MEELWAEGDGLCAARMVNTAAYFVIHSLFLGSFNKYLNGTPTVPGTRNRNNRHMISYLQDPYNLVDSRRDVFS